ncbi:hypothetical protein J6590_041443 [Homalodisca vitripennis]|nr:hypothetical protein J6590_041443 [Homalodisca vitripennis]
MSAATDLHLLHDNVNDSEHLITHLKAEVKQLMSLVHEKYTVTKIKELQDENNKIKNEINAVKKELIQLQIANGVPQFVIGGGSFERIISFRTFVVVISQHFLTFLCPKQLHDDTRCAKKLRGYAGGHLALPTTLLTMATVMAGKGCLCVSVVGQWELSDSEPDNEFIEFISDSGSGESEMDSDTDFDDDTTQELNDKSQSVVECIFRWGNRSTQRIFVLNAQDNQDFAQWLVMTSSTPSRFQTKQGYAGVPWNDDIISSIERR